MAEWNRQLAWATALGVVAGFLFGVALSPPDPFSQVVYVAGAAAVTMPLSIWLVFAGAAGPAERSRRFDRANRGLAGAYLLAMAGVIALRRLSLSVGPIGRLAVVGGAGAVAYWLVYRGGYARVRETLPR